MKTLPRALIFLLVASCAGDRITEDGGVDAGFPDAPDANSDASDDLTTFEASEDSGSADVSDDQSASQCDPVTSNGCDPPSKCGLDCAQMGVACISGGSGAEGDPCSERSDQDCARGYACVGSAGNTWACRRYCRENSECASGQCVNFNASPSCDRSHVGFCTLAPPPDAGPDGPACDPVLGTGCGPSEKCGVSGLTCPTMGLSCVPTGAGRDGDPCADRNDSDCAPGYACVGTRCARYCYSAKSCPHGNGCVTFNAHPECDRSHIGYCNWSQQGDGGQDLPDVGPG